MNASFSESNDTICLICNSNEWAGKKSLQNNQFDSGNMAGFGIWNSEYYIQQK